MSGARAAALAGRPELQELWRQARRHVEARGVTGSVSVQADDPQAARALSGLLGTRRPWLAGDRRRVSLVDLDTALAGHGGLHAVLEAAGGPVHDRRAERDARQRAVDGLWEELAARPAAARPQVAGWLEVQRASGRWTGPGADLAANAQVLGDCLTVAAALPCAQERGLPKFAADWLGDPHALDDGDQHPAGRAVLGLLEALAGPSPLTGAARRRALWAAVGVRVGTLEPVRCAGLRPVGDGPLAQELRGRAAAGWPQWLSGIELAVEPLKIVGPVFCCENREVHEAALAELGPGCPQLVCVDGWPSVTVAALLDRLDPGQARHHGDFDWGGWRIARHLRLRHGVGTWRYDAGELLAARARHPGAGGPLRGSPPPASERDALAEAILADGRSLSEERDLELLLEDLRVVDR